MESTAENSDDRVSRLLSDPQLKDILLSAAELPPNERKLVQDFINWRKNQK
jgi:hypothetical protein